MSAINEEQLREEKMKEMDAKCIMKKGKLTYMDLTRKQWIDRLLQVDPDLKPEEIKDDYHIYEIAQACEPGSDSELESIDSEDEEKEIEYKGRKYKGRELLVLFENEADEAQQKYKEYEKSKKPAKKQKTDKPAKSEGAGKGRKADKGTVWDRFLVGNRTVLGPSVYKKFCEQTGRDLFTPVKFTANDGSTIFKVMEQGQHDDKLRWAKLKEQDLEEGDYF